MVGIPTNHQHNKSTGNGTPSWLEIGHFGGLGGPGGPGDPSKWWEAKSGGGVGEPRPKLQISFSTSRSSLGPESLPSRLVQDSAGHGPRLVELGASNKIDDFGIGAENIRPPEYGPKPKENHRFSKESDSQDAPPGRVGAKIKSTNIL